MEQILIDSEYKIGLEFKIWTKKQYKNVIKAFKFYKNNNNLTI